MKIFKRISISLFFITILMSFTSSTELYKGKWEGEDKGDIGLLILSNDGYATFETGGQVIGGKSYLQNGVEASMEYEVNEKVNPFTIDFIIKLNKNKKELGRMEGILKMVNNDSMMLSIGFGGIPRPENFDKNVITLNRVR